MMLIGDASEVETLKSTLAEAKKEAEEERAARQKHESRVEEVQQELKDAIRKCESLERKILDQNSELAKALQSAQEARVEAQICSLLDVAIKNELNTPIVHKLAWWVQNHT